jgi:hypothetical protein
VRLALKVIIQNYGDFLDVILPYIITFFMRSEVNVAVTLRIAICWDGTSCIMIKNTDVSEEPAASITTADKLLQIEAASSSDMLMYFWQTAQGYIPEERNLPA